MMHQFLVTQEALALQEALNWMESVGM